MTMKLRGKGLDNANTVEGDGESIIANLQPALRHPKDFPQTRQQLADMINDGDVVLLPTTITSANGVRAVFEGDEIPWPVIQGIYARIVEHFALR